ncbi:MAG: DUF3048 domain-containing protein [Bacilli bacterium]|nr:DUF3048 domain-containing protein [Bacilli bacterium]
MNRSRKRRISKKKVFLLILIIILLVGAGVCLWKFVINKGSAPKGKKITAKLEEKVDIVDIESKSRPFAISINNTPVAVKVQEGLNKAFLIYEIPTEGSTARLIAVFKDVEDTKVGTIRSARHNMLDFSYESDAIFVAFGWSHYAKDDMSGSHLIDYVQGIVGEGGMWRDNPENLDSEHTVYLQTETVKNYAKDSKGYALESASASDTILLNYNVIDVDLSDKEGAMVANHVSIDYGSVTNDFNYDADTGMYTRIVNDRVAVDHNTKEPFTTKNIIVQKIKYNRADDGYYWNLHTVDSGEGYYITNGYAIPIKWSKSDRKAKTKFTKLDGEELEVSDGRTYIEVQVASRDTTIE